MFNPSVPMLRAVARAAAALGLAVLAACVSPEVGEYQTSTDYQLGYSDGCATGSTYERGFEETVTRNDELFRESEAYAAGWRDGFQTCGAGQQQRWEARPDFLTDDRFDKGSF